MKQFIKHFDVKKNGKSFGMIITEFDHEIRVSVPAENADALSDFANNYGTRPHMGDGPNRDIIMLKNDGANVFLHFGSKSRSMDAESFIKVISSMDYACKAKKPPTKVGNVSRGTRLNATDAARDMQAALASVGVEVSLADMSAAMTTYEQLQQKRRERPAASPVH